MRRAALVALFAAACVVAIWSLTSWAQAIDATPCEESCYEQKSACDSACGAHDNPMECEAQCQDRLEDCLEQCG